MRVLAKPIDPAALPTAVATWISPDQLFVTAGREYEVHALSVYEGIVFFQIVDDLGYPAWKPAPLFDVTDGSLPGDWTANTLPGQLALILGPAFVARDASTYQAMVELDAEQVRRFWDRVAARERGAGAP